MKQFAFISRHTPSQEQIMLAKAANINLVPVGDVNAFTFDPAEFNHLDWDGAVCVHPAIALKLFKHRLAVGIFEMETRVAPGQGNPAPVAIAFHIFEPKI